MKNNSEAFATIKIDYGQACEGIENCKDSPFNSASLRDAYARVARVRERYKEDQEKLKSNEYAALSKVFKDDVSLKV